MVRARKRPATPPPADDGLDVNAVVSYNVPAIRDLLMVMRRKNEVLTALFGADGAVGNWHDHYRTWRAERIAEVEKDLGSGLDEVAEFLADFAARIKALGPSGYLRSLSGAEDERKPIDEKE